MGLRIERTADARTRRRRLWAVAIVAAALLAIPGLLAGGLGRVVADLWIVAMRVITGLLGGMLG